MEHYFQTLLHGSDQKASDNGKALSEQNGLFIANELLTIISEKSFQQQVWDAHERASGDSKKFAASLAELLMPQHLTVISKYGYSATKQGAVNNSAAFAETLNADPLIAEKSDLFAYLLNPDLQRSLAADVTKTRPRGVPETRVKNPNPSQWVDGEVGKVWVCVGGKEEGKGIIVRKDCSTSSVQLPDRLAYNAVVEIVETKGDRVHYHKMSGDGPDIGWVSTHLKSNILVQPYLQFSRQKKVRKEEEKTYIVVNERVAQRETPSKDAKALGVALKGACFTGVIVSEGGIEWLRILDGRVTKFLMVHGASVGLGQLLEEQGKPSRWKVVHSRIAQRDGPRKDGEMVGYALQGEEHKGHVVKGDDDIEWLLVMEKGEAKYMMIDGESVGLGTLLEKMP